MKSMKKHCRPMECLLGFASLLTAGPSLFPSFGNINPVMTIPLSDIYVCFDEDASVAESGVKLRNKKAANKWVKNPSEFSKAVWLAKRASLLLSQAGKPVIRANRTTPINSIADEVMNILADCGSGKFDR